MFFCIVDSYYDDDDDDDDYSEINNKQIKNVKVCEPSNYDIDYSSKCFLHTHFFGSGGQNDAVHLDGKRMENDRNII